MTNIPMPHLQPLPIKTKGLGFFRRIWALMTVSREWVLTKNYHFQLPNGVDIVIPSGFIFDAASIPKVLWWILSPVGLLLIPGLIHDFAYRYNYLWQIKDGELVKYKHLRGTRHCWDSLFKEVSLQVNGMIATDYIATFFLRLAGDFAWQENRKKNEPELKLIL